MRQAIALHRSHKNPRRSSGFIPLLQLFERLALRGYTFDLSKWETLVNAGLLVGLAPAPSYDCQIPHAMEDRIRAILEVEKRLPPGVPVDKLGFYLAIAGIQGVPAVLIGTYIEASFTKFFIVGDGMLRRLERKPACIGAFGERKLADAMAKTVLRDYPLLVASVRISHAGNCLPQRSSCIFGRHGRTKNQVHAAAGEPADHHARILGLDSASGEEHG